VSEPLLQVQGLVKHFPVFEGLMRREVGSVKAVDGVSFEIARGHTLGLVGESGCGKTTVGRTLLQLERPTAGRILFEGRDIAQLPEKELRSLRRDLQIIFQDPFSSLNPRMTVMDIVGEALEVHDIAKGNERERRALSVLDKVGIPRAWVNRYPHEFSGGQRQRVSIARAVALEPKLIVCDEAVSALDVSIQAQVINLLIELQKEMDLSYLFISHDLSVVKHISDEVAVMYLGEIVETASAARIFGSPAHPYTRALLSAVPIPNPRRRSERIVLEGDVPTPIRPPPGCRFHTRCPAVMERCHEEVPRSVHLGEEQHVRCFLAYEAGTGPDGYAALLARTEQARAARAARTPAPPEEAPEPLPGPSAAPGPSATRREEGPGRDPALAVSGQLVPPETDLTRLFDPSDLPRRLGLLGVGLGVVLVLLGGTFWGTAIAAAGFVGAAAGSLRRPLVCGLGLALLLGLAAWGGSALSDLAQERTAADQREALHRELADYAAATGHYPQQLSELGWRLIPILGSRDPVDPWGRPWRYRPPTADGLDYSLELAKEPDR